MLNRHLLRQEERLAKQEERLASTRKVQSSIVALNRDVAAFKRLDKSPPPYVTPPSSNIAQSKTAIHPNVPRLSPIRNMETTFERTNYVSDPFGRTSGRMAYSRVPTGEGVNFTPLADSPLPQPGYTLDDSP